VTPKSRNRLFKNPNEITLISVSHIGGTLGEYRIIKATKDSVFAEKELQPNISIKNGFSYQY
jgi:hypothetical protein